MADLVIEGDELVLHLRAPREGGGVPRRHPGPARAVSAVRVVDDAWPELRGMRAPGTGLPGVIAVGTRRGGFGKDFAAVHGKGPAVVVELAGTEFGRLVVTTDDADATAAAITVATGQGLRGRGPPAGRTGSVARLPAGLRRRPRTGGRRRSGRRRAGSPGR